MAKSKDFGAPEPDDRPLWRRQLESVLETQIARFPFLVQMRAVWRQLEHERESWPVLLPVLLVVFVFVYRRERRKVEAIIRDVANS